MSKKKYRLCLLLFLFMVGAIVLVRTVNRPEQISAYELPKLEEDNKLIIYTAHKEEIYEPIIREFEERTGIWVQVVSGGTNELLERIAQEKGINSGDVMFGGGVDSLSAYESCFESYSCKQADKLDATYISADHKWTPFSDLPIVFIYNRKLVYAASVPRGWSELLDEHWKGKIAFADPRISGTSYTALATMLQVMRQEKKAQDKILQNFIENLDGSIAEGSGEVLDEVMSGTKMVGITNEELALKKINAGADLEMIYPREGTSVLPDGSAVIKNAPHRENAELFLEFTVSEDVQRFLIEQCDRRSVRNDMEQEPIKEEMHYDLEWAAEHQEELIDKWTQQTEAR